MINFQELYNRSGEQKVSPSKHPSFSIIILTLRIINRSKLDISFEMSKVRLYTITRKCSNYSRTNNLEKMPINLKKMYPPLLPQDDKKETIKISYSKVSPNCSFST